MARARVSVGRYAILSGSAVALLVLAVTLAGSSQSPLTRLADFKLADQLRALAPSSSNLQHYWESSTPDPRHLTWQEYGRKWGVEWEGENGHVKPLPASSQTANSRQQDYSGFLARGPSLKPSKIFPYYYRASHSLSTRNVSIGTMISSDRLVNLARLVESYQGPISVTVHISNGTDVEKRAEFLSKLHDLYATSPYMAKYVDAHVIVDSFDRQFNLWRNIARYFARSDYVLMLDVDMYVSTDFRKSIFEQPAIEDRLASGTAAFVVPPFEYSEQKDGYDPRTFPTDKEELANLYNAGKVRMFHDEFKPGQYPTRYDKFVKTNSSYLVTEYTSRYEPYIVYKRDGTPYCDERFIGYGDNKMACIYELYLSGVSFYVLPRDFLVHINHEYPEKAMHLEKEYNSRLYHHAFTLELCHRYLTQFHQRGMLEEEIADNLFEVCEIHKSFKDTAGYLSKAAVAKRSDPGWDRISV